MLVQRKVAMAASAGYVKSEDFDKFWPMPGKQQEIIDFTTEEYKEWYRSMKIKNNIK